MRQNEWKQNAQQLLVIFVMIVLSFFLGGLILLCARLNPFVVYGQLISGIFSRPQFIAWSIIYATPMILTGLAVAFALQANLFNIGANGQFIMGTVAAVAAGYFIKAPALIHVPITLMAGILGGAVWAAIVGYLKVRHHLHEVVVSIMLNWVALYLCNFFTLLPAVNQPLSEASYSIQPSASLQIHFLSQWLGRSTRVNWGIVIAVILAVFLHYILHRTTFGFKLKAIGLNQDASLASGMPMARMQFSSMTISGAIAGLGGAVYIMDMLPHTVVSSVGDGYGFDGISVALIGLGEPIGVIFAGLFYGALKYSAGKLTSAGTPSELISIIIGCIVYFIAISSALQAWFLRWRKKRMEKTLPASAPGGN